MLDLNLIEKIERTLHELDLLCRQTTFVNDVIWHFLIIGDLEGIETYTPSAFSILTVDTCQFQEMPEGSEGTIIIIPRHYTYMAAETEVDNPFVYVYDEAGNVKLVERQAPISFFEYGPINFQSENHDNQLLVKAAIPMPRFQCKTPHLLRTIKWRE